MMDADLTALSSVDDFIWQYNVFGPVEFYGITAPLRPHRVGKVPFLTYTVMCHLTLAIHPHADLIAQGTGGTSVYHNG